MLALTFGCPVVAPRNPVTESALDSGLVHLFEAGSDDDLVRAITEALGRRHRRGLDEQFAARHRVDRIATRFAEEMRERLG
jgi:hypothetical protein